MRKKEELSKKEWHKPRVISLKFSQTFGGPVTFDEETEFANS